MKQWPNLRENQDKVYIIVTQQSLLKEKRGSKNEEGEREMCKAAWGTTDGKEKHKESPKLRRPLVWYLPPN